VNSLLASLNARSVIRNPKEMGLDASFGMNSSSARKVESIYMLPKVKEPSGGSASSGTGVNYLNI